MGRDWARLAEAVEAARIELGMTQVDLAQAAGVSEGTIQNLESGKDRPRFPTSLPRVERALKWAPGSGDAVFSGGDPIPLPPEEPAPEDVAPSDVQSLPLRIQQELADGPLLDTTVLDLTPLGSDARMIVVVKGKPDATPEQIRRDLLAWAKAQHLLQNLSDSDDTTEIAN
ncbi:helix-turn-helix transcriptional regulator [Streptomyces xanthochromogenes]|uniref:helix-turn-helix transcriptional regulator n=1 Tax=Streptomyces xanthochromogenes TaxID=67384 RepID=UPI00382D1C44